MDILGGIPPCYRTQTNVASTENSTTHKDICYSKLDYKEQKTIIFC